MLARTWHETDQRVGRIMIRRYAKMAGYAFHLRSSSYGGQVGSNPPYELSPPVGQISSQIAMSATPRTVARSEDRGRFGGPVPDKPESACVDPRQRMGGREAYYFSTLPGILNIGRGR
jgi:hypothetical protein